LSNAQAKQVAPILERYELDLDRPLAAIQAMWDDEMHWTDERRATEEDSITRHAMERGDEIVALNRRTLRWLIDVLGSEPGGAGDRIRVAAWTGAYNVVYEAPRPCTRALERVQILDDLSQDQQAMIDSLAAIYWRESEEVERRGRERCDAA